MTSCAVLDPSATTPSIADLPRERPHAEYIWLPRLRSVLAHAGRYTMVGTVVPTALFYVLFDRVGLDAALVAVLAWSLALIGQRARRARRIEATLVLSAGLTVVRIVTTWCTGSAVVYLAQPLVSTFATAAALLVSVAVGRPFTERVTRDFVPLPAHLSGHATIQACFGHASVIFGAAYLLNGSASVWLLTHLSIGQFMVVGKAFGLIVTGTALLACLTLFICTLRRHRIRLRFSPS